MSRRARRRAVALALVVAIAATATIVLWPGSGRPGAEAQAGAPSSTATVERRTLRESEIVGGTYGYGEAVALVHRAGSPSLGSGDGGSGSGTGGSGSGSGGGSGAGGSGSGSSGDGSNEGQGAGNGRGGGTSGSGTLTETAAVGDVVRRGGVLYRVDQRPVRLLYGTIPAWRTLRAGLRGRDVRQLQLNLAALGYGPLTVDGVFSSGTADAVRRWQRATDRAETGGVVLGEVVFADGARRIASVEAAVGVPLGDGTTVLEATSTVRLVRVPLDAAKQQLARRGARVTVTLPNQRTVGGRIVDVGPVTSSGSGDGGGGGAGGGSGEEKAKLDVLVRLRSSEAAGRLDHAPVSVALTREIRRRALAVPVTALVAHRGGEYALRVVRGATTTVVPVRVGMFSDGLAEVSGPGVHEGDRVAVPDVA